MAKFSILVLGDSRLRDVEHRLVTLLDAWGYTDVEINVVFFPGASVRRVVDRGMRTLDGRLLILT